MNNIIEKLGITPEPWECVEYSVGKSMDYYHHCGSGALGYKPLEEKHGDSMMRYKKEDAQLIATAPEMLGAFIELVASYEILHNYNRPTNYAKWVKIIEKATGKSWSEIKELLVWVKTIE